MRLHGEQLVCDLRVINTDDKPFDFTAALHTYIEVLAIEKAKITGLKGGAPGKGEERLAVVSSSLATLRRGACMARIWYT